MIEKIRNQILQLRRRGYRRRDMKLRITEKARDELLREVATSSGMTSAATVLSLDEFDGIPLEILPGLLSTYYVLVPFAKIEFFVEPGGTNMVRLIDADRRILDDRTVYHDGHKVVFVTEHTFEYPNARVDLVGRVKSAQKIAQ